jgi:hypothetical protein
MFGRKILEKLQQTRYRDFQHLALVVTGNHEGYYPPWFF